LAFSWNEDWSIDLSIVSLDGSESDMIHRSDLWQKESGRWADPADWSSDGELILARVAGVHDHDQQIGIISVSDGSLRILKSLYCREATHLRFSPDGRHVVYDYSPEADELNRDIALVSIETGDEIQLIEHPADDYFVGWAPDGRSLLIASNRSGEYDAWVLPVSEAGPAGEPILVKPGIGRIRPLGVTDDGALFYARGVRTWDVYSAELDLESGVLGEPSALIAEKQFEPRRSPDWSRDGQGLAFVTRTTGTGNPVVRIRDVSTGDEQDLIPGLSSLSYIHWSPDGKSFLANGEDLEGQAGYFVIGRRTGTTEPVAISHEDDAVFDGQWFPDGTRVLYARNSSREGWAKLVAHDLETGAEEEIVQVTENRLIGSAALSPDGNSLAFVVWDLDERGMPQTLKLLVTPIPSGPPTELFQVRPPDAIAGLSWSGDSGSLLFIRANMGRSDAKAEPEQYWQISASGGEPKRLGFLSDIVGVRGPRIHPDGSRIAYTRGDERVVVWAMEGWEPDAQ
jgi:Tol biopolymer transport system component